MHADILCTGRTTCNSRRYGGGELDYAVASNSLASIIHVKRAPTPWKPQWGLEFVINAAPRKVLVSKLYVPAPLPTDKL